MGARTAMCPTCGRAWSGREARFCGACGERLHLHQRRGPARAGRVVGVLAGGLAVIVMAGLAIVVSDGRTSLGTGGPEVELGDGPIEPSDSPLSADEAEVLRQQVDPGRLRCEPRGCEIWRREREQPSGVVAVGDQVVLLEGVQVTGLDRDTGAERWTAPVGHLRSVTSDGEQVRATGGRGEIVAAADDAGVYLITGNEVSLIGLDGERIWSERPEPGIAWSATALPDQLILHGPQTGGNVHRIAALDAATGQTGWTAGSAGVHVVDPDIIMVSTADRRLLAVDPATGFTMWGRNPRGTWAESAGPWIAHHGETGITLLDRSNGEVSANLPGFLTTSVTPVGDLWLAVIASLTGGGTVEHPSPLMVLALTEDGQMVWDRPVETDQASDCCSILVPDDDGRRLTLAGGGILREIDAATGEVIAERQPEIDRDHANDRDATDWYAPDGTLVRWSGSGQLTIAAADGGADIRGDDVWIELLDPLVVGSMDHLMGVRLLADG